jgi:hypothetical protein
MRPGSSSCSRIDVHQHSRSGSICNVQIDLLFDPFGATWHDVQEGAIAAEGEGFDGIWLYDHLAGSVHGQPRVLESWT